jgi:hypothetical protein
MKTQYPNGQNIKQYIGVLTSEYQTVYSDFSPKTIKTHISEVVEGIDYNINELESDDGKLFPINELKRISAGSLTTEEKDKFIGGMAIILCYCEKVEDVVRDRIEALEIPFPEEYKEEYLEFISKMTKRAIKDICAATEEKIPHSAKIKYQRLISGEKDTVEELRENKQLEKTFVERVGTKRGQHTKHHEQKKRSIRFADNIDVKKLKPIGVSGNKSILR